MQAPALTRPDIRQELESYLEFMKVPAGVPFQVERTFIDLRALPKGIQTHSLTTYPTLTAALEHFKIANVAPLMWLRLRVKIADFDEIIASKCAANYLRETWSWRNNGRGNSAHDVASARAIQLHLGNELESPVPMESSNTTH